MKALDKAVDLDLKFYFWSVIWFVFFCSGSKHTTNAVSFLKIVLMPLKSPDMTSLYS